MQLGPSNFLFLKQHDTQLLRLDALAERYFHDDPKTCLIKLWKFAELLAQLIAAKTGLLRLGEEAQAKFERLLPPQVADLFHEIRILGNRASHGASGIASEALNALKYARQDGGGELVRQGPNDEPVQIEIEVATQTQLRRARPTKQRIPASR